jgi:hypothetical protein
MRVQANITSPEIFVQFRVDLLRSERHGLTAISHARCVAFARLGDLQDTPSPTAFLPYPHEGKLVLYAGLTQGPSKNSTIFTG